MPRWGYRPSPLIERKGSDFFEPVHPQPLTTPNGLIQTVFGARDNLIGNWLHEHYTSGCHTFRIMGRQVLLANSPASIQQILVADHKNFERKAPQVRRALESVIGNGSFISDGAIWSERRPIVVEALNKSRLATFGAAMEMVTNEFCNRWDLIPEGTVLNIQQEMAALTAEIVTRAVFGAQISPDEIRRVAEGFTLFQNQVDSFNLGYFIGFDEGLRVRNGRKARQAIAELHRTIGCIVDRYLESDGVENSVLYQLMKSHSNSKDRSSGLKILFEETATIFLAGHETTAIILTWAWYLIANAPWIQKELHIEIDQTADGRPLAFADIPKLRWARAIIEETMRLYPPIPLYSRQPSIDTEILDIPLKKGALVLVVPWLLHRARDLWDEPDLFRPERFLSARPPAFSYIPFSVGPRVCSGVSFGMAEAVLCLAMLAQRFTVLPLGNAVVPSCRLTLRPRGGLSANIKRRT